MQVLEIIVEKAEHVVEEEDPNKGINSGIVSIGNVRLKDVSVNNEDNPFDTEFEIKVVKRFQPWPNDEDQITFLETVYDEMDTDPNMFTVKTISSSLSIIQEDVDPNKVDSRLVSMHEYDIELVDDFDVAGSETDDTIKSKPKVNMSKSEEASVDQLLDELDELSRTKCSTLDAFADKYDDSYPLGHLHKEIISLTFKAQHLESFNTQQVAYKLEEYVPELVDEELKATLPEILTESLKNVMPQIVVESVKQTIKKSFNTFNKLECAGFVVLQKDLSKVLKTKIRKSIKKEVIKGIEEIPNPTQGEQQPKDDEMESVQKEQPPVQELTSSEQAPLITEPVLTVSTTLVVDTLEENTSEEQVSEEEPPFKRLKFLIPNPTTSSPTPLSFVLPQDVKQLTAVNMSIDQFTDGLFKTTSSEYSPTPLRDERKGKGISTKEDPLKVLVPLIDEGGSAPKMPNLNQFSISKEGKLTLDDIKNQAKKLGIPPPPELTSFRLSTIEKKRKRSSEILKEVFVTEDITVDGMYRNLIPSQGVVGSRGLVITKPEARIFFYNGNFDLDFQRDNEFHLAISQHLIRTQSAIQRNTLETEEIYKKMKMAIEARNDVTMARKIIKQPRWSWNASAGIKGLVEYKALASNLRCIQVKDIIKEVEDYLNTNSSDGMDINNELMRHLYYERAAMSKRLRDDVEKVGVKDSCRCLRCKVKRILEAHYGFMAKTSEFLPAESSSMIRIGTSSSIRTDELVKKSLLTKSQLEGYLKRTHRSFRFKGTQKFNLEKPCLYEIPFDTSDPANRFAPDREETMTLDNESRSKLDKDTVKPYDYTRQNSLYEIFKAPSLEYLYQLERAKEVRKTMWRKPFVRTKPNIAKNIAFLPGFSESD
ncbi:hypothetical protein Tco_1315683 [Tanacetum coccineum]